MIWQLDGTLTHYLALVFDALQLCCRA